MLVKWNECKDTELIYFYNFYRKSSSEVHIEWTFELYNEIVFRGLDDRL
jgi:hypothetical protein